MGGLVGVPDAAVADGLRIGVRMVVGGCVAEAGMRGKLVGDTAVGEEGAAEEVTGEEQGRSFGTSVSMSSMRDVFADAAGLAL